MTRPVTRPVTALFSTLVSLAFAACANPAQHDSPSANTKQAASPTPTAQSALTRFVRARAPALAALTEAPARAIAQPGTDAHIALASRAQVQRIHVRIGDHVTRGTPIITLLAPELAAAASRASAIADQITLTAARLAALEKLKADGLTRAGDLYDVQSTLAALRSDAALAHATLRAASLTPSQIDALATHGTLTLTSPVAGIVTTLRATHGAIIDPSPEPIAHIRGVSFPRIEARFASRPPTDFSATFVTLDNITIPLVSPPVATTTDPAHGTLVAWFDAADGAPAIASETLGTIHLTLTSKTAVEVPTTSLGYTRGTAHIYVRRGAHPTRTPVTVLTQNLGNAIVKGDVHIGDDVAVSAAALDAPRDNAHGDDH